MKKLTDTQLLDALEEMAVRYWKRSQTLRCDDPSPLRLVVEAGEIRLCVFPERTRHKVHSTVRSAIAEMIQLRKGKTT